MIKNNKGISAIVATVLIILITVAAVTIVWAAIIPMINNQLQTGTLCFDAVSQLQVLDNGYTCYNVSGGTGNVSVQIGLGSKDVGLQDIQVLISSGGSTSSKKVTVDAVGTPAVPGPNEQKVYIFTGFANPPGVDSVQVAPIIKVGNTEKTCDVGAELNVKSC